MIQVITWVLMGIAALLVAYALLLGGCVIYCILRHDHLFRQSSPDGTASDKPIGMLTRAEEEAGMTVYIQVREQDE